jgi:hypothetical protein
VPRRSHIAESTAGLGHFGRYSNRRNERKSQSQSARRHLLPRVL